MKEQNCLNCIHKYVCQYCNGMATILRDIKTHHAQLSLLDGNVEWAVNNAKKIIGGNCAYYHKGNPEKP